MPPILGFLILLAIVIFFGSSLVYLTSKIGPKPSVEAGSSRTKGKPYECGLESVTPKGKKISVDYYLTGILFVLFDIEIVFLYPWAVAYKEFIKEGVGLYAFIGLLVFLFIFTLGLVWEIKSKALKWT